MRTVVSASRPHDQRHPDRHDSDIAIRAALGLRRPEQLVHGHREQYQSPTGLEVVLRGPEETEHRRSHDPERQRDAERRECRLRGEPAVSGELHPLGQRDEERQDAEGVYG
jgi:hypothetical protein